MNHDPCTVHGLSPSAVKKRKLKCECEACLKYKDWEAFSNIERGNVNRPERCPEGTTFEEYRKIQAEERARRKFVPRCSEDNNTHAWTGYKAGCRCDVCNTYGRYLRASKRQTYKKTGGADVDCTFEEFYAACQVTHCDCCGIKLEEGTDGPNVSCIDHCHVTGKLRGTLCRSCNFAEGQLKTIERCEQMLDYMKRIGE